MPKYPPLWCGDNLVLIDSYPFMAKEEVDKALAVDGEVTAEIYKQITQGG